MSWNEPALRKDEPGSTDAGIIRTSLYEQVLRQLRQEIVDGILSPNEHHSAISLAQRLGVSRTPVREALLTLERDGLVRIIPNTGVRILTAGLEELVASFELRLLLEIPTVARSLEGADDEDLDAIRAGAARALRVHILSTAGLLIDRLAGAQGVDPEPFKRRLAETVEI